MHLSRARWILLLSLTGATVFACESQSMSGSSKKKCTDDTDCRTDQVCEEERCVAYDGSSGAGSGSTSGGSTTSTGSGMTPANDGLCADYLTCLATANPDALPEALTAYGPEGSCWQGGPEVQAACGTACFESMKSLHSYEPTLCFECYVDSDCGGGGTCESGSCAYSGIALPGADADCAECVNGSNAGNCQDYAQMCAQSEECMAAGVCAAACAPGDYACYDQCNVFATGYWDYVNCSCSSCYESCYDVTICASVG
jgi:hypothetical protein